MTRRSATQSGLRESASSEGSDAFPVWRFCNTQIESGGEVDGGVRVVPRAGDGGECGASAHADDGEGGEEDGVRGVGETEAVKGGEVQREEEGGVEEERVLVFVGTKRVTSSFELSSSLSSSCCFPSLSPPSWASSSPLWTSPCLFPLWASP